MSRLVLDMRILSHIEHTKLPLIDVKSISVIKICKKYLKRWVKREKGNLIRNNSNKILYIYMYRYKFNTIEV